jgi:Tripartite ATP-independent periplasmic transporter, DctM component
MSAVAVSVAIYKKLPRQKFDIKELVQSFLLALPELFVPFGVILGLAAGIGLSEVAALTVLYTILLEVFVSRGLVKAGVQWGKPLDPRVLWTTTREAMAMVGAIFIIIFASTALTNFMVTAEVPKKLVAWTLEHVESKIVFLLAINLMLLVVGTVMDIFSAIVVVLPLIAPIAKAYGIDPYHLGVIFLLNLEVGYLHPPVGLNLFITSVKFQRPITEVMWATVPFLITMIVALLVITYVPALTVVPEAERTGQISNLVTLVHTSAEEGRAIKEVAIVDAAGNPLKDQKGTVVVKKLDECNTITDTPKKDACQKLFFDVSNCKADADVTKCSNKAIAAWVVSELNGDILDQSKAIIVIDEILLVNAEGEPVKDKAGAQVKKTRAECDKLEGSYQETCRELFINASTCKINPPDDGNIDGCVAEKVGEWVDANASAEE